MSLDDDAISEEWFYTDHAGQRNGPLPLEQLVKLASLGEIQPTTLIQKGNGGVWQQASAVSELSAVRFSEFARTKQAIPIGKQIFTGFAKGVFLVLLLAFGCLSLFTPFGPLYPGLSWIIVLNAPEKSAVIYFAAIVSGVIGMCINLKKGASGLVGFLGGVLAGPFWVWFFLLAKGRQ